MKKRHRLLALVLAVSMCMPMMAVSTYADEEIVVATDTIMEAAKNAEEEIEAETMEAEVTAEDTEASGVLESSETEDTTGLMTYPYG